MVRSTQQALGGSLRAVVTAAASQPEKIQPAWFVPLIAGGMATAVADVVVHPIDTIKTVQQAGRRSPTNTIAGAIGLILKKSGPLGFYNGVCLIFILYFPLFSRIACFDFSKHYAFFLQARSLISHLIRSPAASNSLPMRPSIAGESPRLYI
jgi:hypothetical protein